MPLLKNLSKQLITTGLSALFILILGIPTQATANTTNIDTNTLVGSTAGNFSVNQGAANYNIPITLPPGVAGMVPELSIDYNSNNGNSILGTGFNLSGLSAIHRCGKTLATDGQKGGVNYDDNDKYCLDGQRLITISGNAGQANSKYKTEIDSFSRITFNGNHWTVQTKSGQSFEYGNSNDSKIEAQGKQTIRLWNVSKITDATNNAITYHYNEDNTKGEYSLNQINYANNTNSIQFTYEDREDITTGYQAGSQLNQSKRLSSITTTTNNQAVRSYNLDYEYSNTTPKRSQLTSVQECVSNNTSEGQGCLPKTVFNQYEIDIENDGNFTQKQYTIANWGSGASIGTSGDFNGDGLTDFLTYDAINGSDNRLNSNTSRQVVHLSNGDGSFTQKQYTIGAWGNGGFIGTSGDFNGDGLTDFLTYDAINGSDNRLNSNTSRQVVHLSNGDGSFTQKQYTIANWGSGASIGTSGDFNGDGLTDFLTYDAINGSDNRFNNHTDRQIVHLSKSQQFKLQTITNGLGIQTTLNYKPLTDSSVYTKDNTSLDASDPSNTYPNINLQNARQVISSVVTDNAVGGQNTTTYQYGGAKANLKGRGNLGFRWIETFDEQSHKLTRTEFRQDYPFVGQISKTEEYIQANADDVNTRQLLNIQTNSYQDQSVSVSDHSIHLPYLSQSTEQSYDFNSGALLSTITTQQTNIDAYGNISNINVTTTGNGQTFSKTTQNTYSNDIDNWHLGRLTNAQVTHHSSEDNTPNITRNSSFTYNSDGLLASETIEPNTNKALTTTYEYDNFGNKIKVTTSGADIEPRTTHTQYSTDGKFPISTSNALGHTETKTYDPSTGNILSLTGPNGLTTTWQYDALGRKTKEMRADGTSTTTDYNWVGNTSNTIIGENQSLNSFSNNLNAIYKISSQVNSNNDTTTPAKTTYYDAFNRKVREAHTGFDGTPIHQDTIYDNLSKVNKASLPYFETDTAYFVTTEYDAIGRLIQTISPDSFGNTKAKSTQYQGFKTINTNEAGNQKTISKNAIGKIIRIDEPEGAWLTHHHDAIGNLTKTNVGDITTTINYDNSGNKISMNDPDMGIWSYSYNALGELTSQTDAKAQTVNMQYDKLGRMTQRTEPEGQTTWVYDTADKGIGKIASVSAPLGYKKTYNYDTLGRAKDTITTINAQDFSVSNQYDGYSRLQTQTQPKNFNIENVYNQYGYLSAIRSPKTQIKDYDSRQIQHAYNIAQQVFDATITDINSIDVLIQSYRDKITEYQSVYDTKRNYPAIAQTLRDIASDLEQDGSISQISTKLASAQSMLNPIVAAFYGLTDIPQAIATLEQLIQTLSEQNITTVEQLSNYLANVDSFINQDTQSDYLAGISDILADGENAYFYRITARDASNRLTNHITGNGLATQTNYDQASGQIHAIKSGFSFASDIRHLSYEYDVMNNVTNRQNHQSGLSEDFQYDALDRLTQSNTTGQIGNTAYNNSINYQFDINGNITFKSDIGNYNYNPNKPHAIDQVNNTSNPTTDTNTYQYDANGSMTQNGDKAISWTSFNKPKSFTKDSDTTTFIYGPDRARYQKVQTNDNLYKRTTYIGKSYEQIVEGNKTQDRYFIYVDGKLIAIHSKIATLDETTSVLTTNSDQTRYLHYDNLGSIDTITDGRAQIVERMSYAAFGERRKGDWRVSDDSSTAVPIIPMLTNRGFTGHEHIDEMGLIHMNGRVYDPSIGRFLSADPNIFHPYNTQDYNRYSYTTNNPLKYVDPSGYGWLSSIFKGIKNAIRGVIRAIKKHARVIVAAVAAYYAGGAINSWFIKGAQTAIGIGPLTSAVYTQAAILSGAAGGATFGFSNTILHGGSFRDALKNAATGGIAGAITGGIAGHYSGTWNAQRIGASALGGGVSAELQGGKFRDGFKAAFVSSSLRYVYNKVVKFDVDGRAGGDAVYKDSQGRAVKGANNFSFDHKATKPYLIGSSIPIDKIVSGSEGSFWSKLANRAPFALNNVAGFHDNIFAEGYITSFNLLTNVSTMIPAAAISYGALTDKYGISVQLKSKSE